MPSRERLPVRSPQHAALHVTDRMVWRGKAQINGVASFIGSRIATTSGALCPLPSPLDHHRPEAVSRQLHQMAGFRDFEGSVEHQASFYSILPSRRSRRCRKGAALLGFEYHVPEIAFATTISGHDLPF
jgi:hypothetical protein